MGKFAPAVIVCTVRSKVFARVPLLKKGTGLLSLFPWRWNMGPPSLA